ncbi:MAG: alpha/beta hydrolase [Candidatus Eremiobacteraeota bacterium]|nr:alpha/beta hydrolase [Candidatus Eremiobacteraeota bacterium]MBV8435764.1 alpha/beta hydrolase [Candidatus Eremiobacteraeota bacterium]
MRFRSMRLVLLGICTFGLALYFAAPARADCVARAGSIFFVTDRQPLDDNQLFSGEWGTDANHHAVITSGVISAPLDKSNESRCSSQAAFFKALRSQFDPKRPRQVLIYVHGYYTSFVTAVETAMALQKGIQFPGPMIVYSWPARKTSVLAYKTDEANVKWSMPHFEALLEATHQAFPGMPISLAGYSMGGRFVTNGIEFLRRDGCGNCFGRAVLFAPDVFTADLRSALTSANLCSGKPLSHPIASAHVLLYVSNDDRALRQSEKIHGNQRAGQAGGDLILCNGVNTVDVSYLDAGGKSGHGYLLDPQVQRDTAAAFAGVPPTSHLRGLKQVSRSGGIYYELLPSSDNPPR